MLDFCFLFVFAGGVGGFFFLLLLFCFCFSIRLIFDGEDMMFLQTSPLKDSTFSFYLQLSQRKNVCPSW